MKPELILQSDLLDIVFDNKNKEYGAYELRKHYNKRLQRSMLVTFLLVIVFAVLQSWKVPHRVGSLAFINFDSVKLTSVDLTPVKPPPPEPKETIKQPKQLAERKYTAYDIVEDEKVKDPLPTIEDLTNKIISDKNVDGANIGDANLVKPISSGNSATATATVVETKMEPLRYAELMPEFPGGMSEFLKFMQRNLKEPSDMEEAQKLVVIAQFVVDADGNISDLKIVQTARPDLDAEVLRVIKKMPQWKPGMQNGRKVPVFCKLPVTFVSAE